MEKEIKEKKELSDAEMVEKFGFTLDEITTLKGSAFKTLTTSADIGAALHLCKTYKLDPYANEMYAYVQQNKVLMVIGYQGWLKLLRRNKEYDPGSLTINAYFSDDTIKIDFISGEIEHKSSLTDIDDEADPKGAYCSAVINGKKSVKNVRWSEYSKKGQDKYNAWNKQKSEMICAKAAAVFGRTYCGVSGIYAEGEIERKPLEHQDDPSFKKRKPKTPQELTDQFKRRKEDAFKDKEVLDI